MFPVSKKKKEADLFRVCLLIQLHFCTGSARCGPLATKRRAHHGVIHKTSANARGLHRTHAPPLFHSTCTATDVLWADYIVNRIHLQGGVDIAPNTVRLRWRQEA